MRSRADITGVLQRPMRAISGDCPGWVNADSAASTLECQGKAGSAVDGALGVKFGGEVGPADHMDCAATGDQVVGQAAVGQLSGAEDDGIGRDQFRIFPCVPRGLPEFRRA